MKEKSENRGQNAILENFVTLDAESAVLTNQDAPSGKAPTWEAMRGATWAIHVRTIERLRSILARTDGLDALPPKCNQTTRFKRNRTVHIRSR